ncbi:hypothetical protein D3C71_1269370 [compost metagenome]
MPQAGLAPRGIGRAIALLVPFHEDLEGVAALADQPIAHPAAEAPPIGHDVQGFQHAGLAGAVVTGDQVDPRLGRHFHAVEATNLVQGQATDVHAVDHGRARRQSGRGNRSAYCIGQVPRGPARGR